MRKSSGYLPALQASANEIAFLARASTSCISSFTKHCLSGLTVVRIQHEAQAARARKAATGVSRIWRLLVTPSQRFMRWSNRLRRRHNRLRWRCHGFRWRCDRFRRRRNRFGRFLLFQRLPVFLTLHGLSSVAPSVTAATVSAADILPCCNENPVRPCMHNFPRAWYRSWTGSSSTCKCRPG